MENKSWPDCRPPKSACQNWPQWKKGLAMGNIPLKEDRTIGAEWICTDNYYLVATDGEIITEILYLDESKLYWTNKKKYKSLDSAKAAVMRGLR